MDSEIIPRDERDLQREKLLIDSKMCPLCNRSKSTNDGFVCRKCREDQSWRRIL